MKLSQVLPEVIRLSQAISDYWETELPKRHPHYPLEYPGEDSGPPPPEEKTLRDLLDGLPEDALYKIALIMRLGFGHFGTDKLASEYQRVKERFGPREEAVAILAGAGSLGDELSDGLEKLRKAGIDVDKLNFKTARPRK